MTCSCNFQHLHHNWPLSTVILFINLSMCNIVGFSSATTSIIRATAEISFVCFQFCKFFYFSISNFSQFSHFSLLLSVVAQKVRIIYGSIVANKVENVDAFLSIIWFIDDKVPDKREASHHLNTERCSLADKGKAVQCRQKCKACVCVWWWINNVTFTQLIWSTYHFFPLFPLFFLPSCIICTM